MTPCCKTPPPVHAMLAIAAAVPAAPTRVFSKLKRCVTLLTPCA